MTVSASTEPATLTTLLDNSSALRLFTNSRLQVHHVLVTSDILIK